MRVFFVFASSKKLVILLPFLLHSLLSFVRLSNPPFPPPLSFQTLYPNCSSMAIDLLKKLLVFEPGERMDAAAALNHPYFDNMKANSKIPDPPICR